MDPDPFLLTSLDVARACEFTDVDSEYIHRLFDGYTNDRMADYSTFQRATGWEPEIDFEEGVTLMCEPYLDADKR